MSATAQLAFYAPPRRSSKKLSSIIYTAKFNLSWKTHNTASGKKRSAVLQMVQFLSKVYDLYDDKNVQTLSVLYLEFSKAFDKVPHSILIAKLRSIGLGIQIQDIKQDYLTDRMHFVKINKSSSTLKEETSGVPQGSILGPLFLSYSLTTFPNALRIRIVLTIVTI